jgi:hypothetical protein
VKSFVQIKNILGKFVKVKIEDIYLLLLDYHDGSLTINEDVYYFSGSYAEKKFKNILNMMFDLEHTLLVRKTNVVKDKKKV